MDNISRSKDRYRTIVELAPSIVYTLSRDGIITSLNPAFERITGWKVSNWVGKGFAPLVHPDDLPLAVKAVRQALRGKRPDLFEVRVLSKAGDYLVLQVSIAPDIIGGKIVGEIGIARDVTLNKKEDFISDHYINTIKSADSAIITRDLNDIILTWNKASEKLFGYTAGEVIGKSFSILVPRENRGELAKIVKKVKRRVHMETYETVRISKDGRKIPIIAKISPIIDHEGKVVGTSIFDRDNSYNKKNEDWDKFIISASKILSSSLNYGATLKRVAKIMVPHIADWSSVHILQDGKLVQLTVAHKDPKKVKWALELQKKYAKRANENEPERIRKLMEGSQFYPYIDDELLKKLVPGKDDRKIIKDLGLISAITVPIMSGKKLLGSLSLVSTDKNRLYDEKDLRMIEDLGRRAGSAIENARLYDEAQNEIKKRKKAESELRSSRDQLNIILQNIADGILVFDGRGETIYANDVMALASGYRSTQEMIKNPLIWTKDFKLLDEYGEELSIDRLPGRRALHGELDPSAVINTVNSKTGENKWSIVKARPVFDEMGHVTAVVAITNDITGRMELERRKDDFISIASHELKTPLTSIKGFVHLLKRSETFDSKNMYFIRKIESQIDKLTELVQDLLDVSKINSGKLVYKNEKFNISDLVHEIVEDVQKTSTQHEIVVKNGIRAKVEGDRDRISQVLVNLLTNAIKYSPESSKIIVDARRDDQRVIIGVRDYGIGIDESEADKIFDRFYRVKDTSDKTFPGLGIGLYISKEIVSRHKGKIWVESSKGHGSTFYFSLPVA